MIVESYIPALDRATDTSDQMTTGDFDFVNTELAFLVVAGAVVAVAVASPIVTSMPQVHNFRIVEVVAKRDSENIP